MTRDRAIELVTRYDDSCSANYIESFCSFIGIPVNEFWEKIYGSVNRNLFDIQSDGSIRRKFQVGVGL
jgi:hypothetical protein